MLCSLMVLMLLHVTTLSYAMTVTCNIGHIFFFVTVTVMCDFPTLHLSNDLTK